MAVDYIELKIKSKEPFFEIFTAELAELGFDTFQEEGNHLLAYGGEESIDLETVKEKMGSYAEIAASSYEISKVEKQNWNEEWEKNFDPIFVDDKCAVRASFHKLEKEYQYEIIITPKMSFGTGHHATTHMMLSYLLEENLKDKSVVDLGCGTGILAIMAKKRGAKTIAACDIDEWCMENSEENFSLNKAKDITVMLGAVKECFSLPTYEVVLANINKNVLLEEIQQYAEIIYPNGHLFLSGFYESDIDDIVLEANKHGFEYLNKKVKDNWASVKLVKSH